MSEATTDEQIENWKTELASAMADQKWRHALQLCSWLRYTLDQQGHADPKVEQMHDQAKKALAEQVSQERTAKEYQRQRRHLRSVITNQLTLGNWLQALDAIKAFYHNGAGQEETLELLQSFQDRLSDRLYTAQRPTDTQATELKQRFSDLLEQLRSDT